MKKRVLDIEDVLWWTFRDELPKGFRSNGRLDNVGFPSVSPMFSMVAYGGPVDNWAREPGFPAAMGEPHPDALKVAAAVENLARFADQPVEGDLGLAPDFAALGVDEERAMRHALVSVISTVIRCAKLKERPFWTSTVRYAGPVLMANGKPVVVRWEPITRPAWGDREVTQEELMPVEVRQKNVYPEGAHSPLKFDPPPQSVVDERAEYAVWWGALNVLAQELIGQLDSIIVIEPAAAQRPWTDRRDCGKPPRVFEDLSARIYKTQARQTAEAYRQLGARRSFGVRTTGTPRFAPRRAHVPAVAAAG